MSTPYVFDEFFASGLEESTSPFLTRSSKKWGKSLLIKSAFVSLFFFIAAFIFSFYQPSLAKLFISFVFFFSGTLALISAIEDIKNLQININMMMTIAAFAALSLGSYVEGALLLVLFAFSSALEENVAYKTKEALHHLHKLVPKMAYTIESSGKIIEKPIHDIPIGTHLLIKEGETIPLDGKILTGSAFLSLAHLSGEHIPITKTIGDEIPSGARNLEGILTMEVIRSSSDSTVMKLIELITQAGEAKPKVQNFLDRFGKYYAIFVILFTLAYMLITPFLFSFSYLGAHGSVYRGLSFFIAASPCALILAIPTSYFSALSSAAKKGVILKGGNILDAISSCLFFAFDKTGTLTTGQFHCDEVVYLGNKETFSQKEAIQIAAALEKHSHHPISAALMRKKESENLTDLEILSFSSTSGFGIQGKVRLKGKELEAYIGRLSYILPHLSSDQKKHIEERIDSASKGKSYTLLYVEGDLFLFVFTDSIRKEAKHMIECLHKSGRKTILLTGDHQKTAEDVGHFLGITEVHYSLKPKDKLIQIGKLAKSENLAMVGDGINDAPALARATVGISMGKGASQVAIDASDVVILREDLSLVNWIYDKACCTKRVILETFTDSFGWMGGASLAACFGVFPYG
ncbi:MAG: cation-translocating P-type ATPase [Chlamydiota bacterium]